MYLISIFLKTIGGLSTVQLRVWGFCPWSFCPGGWGLSIPRMKKAVDGFVGKQQMVVFKKKKKKSNVNPFPNMQWFLLVCSTSLFKTLWEMEKLLITSNFSFSHSVFYPFGEHSAIFIKFNIVICKLLQFGRV